MLQKSFLCLNKSRPVFLSPLSKSTSSRPCLNKLTKLNTNLKSICLRPISTSSKSLNDYTDQGFNKDKIYELDFSPYKNNLNEFNNQSNGSNNQIVNQNQDELSIHNYGLDLDPNSIVMERDYIQSIIPELPPTFNLATFANQLDIIRQLIKLNVKLYEIEKDRELSKFLISLNFDRDVVPYLNFLIRCGFKRSDIGDFLSANFLILKQDLENLNKRIEYYRKMKFTKKEILGMMIYYQKFINYPIDFVDDKLGYLQRNLKIKPFFVRKMLVGCPRILREDKTALELKKFALIEQCGFRKYQMISILTNSSKIMVRENNRITGTFEYIYNNITKDLDLICKFSDILCVNVRILEERHLYLKKIGRAQYDPLKPLYVPLYAFVIIEEEFLRQFCKTSEKDFYRFVKTL